MDQSENRKEHYQERFDRDERLIPGELSTTLAALKTDVEWIKEKLKSMDSLFVTQAEFVPVRMIAFGLVGILLASVVVALFTLLLNHGR